MDIMKFHYLKKIVNVIYKIIKNKISFILIKIIYKKIILECDFKCTTCIDSSSNCK